MTKMLVPPYSERMGDTRGCTGATMEDGTVYRANRRGQFDVERGDHVRAMLKDPNIAGDIVKETAACRVDFAGRPGRFCSAVCDPTEYQPWTKSCPRCGAPTEVRDVV
jgi:hypothetical protein